MFVGTPCGQFWSPASARVYTAGGDFFDPRLGTYFNLVPKNEVMVPSIASGDVGTTTRSEGGQSGYSSYSSCQDSLAVKEGGAGLDGNP